MAIQAENEAEKRMMQKIARVLDETRASHATHIRKLKDLSTLRSSSPHLFFSAFSKTLTPLFNFQRRNASSDRIVRFVAIFASNRDSNNPPLSDSFLDSLLRFLLVATSAANRTARFRACQIISEETRFQIYRSWNLRPDHLKMGCGKLTYEKQLRRFVVP